MQKTRAFAADGWKLDLTDEEILEKLLSLGFLRFASGVHASHKFGEIIKSGLKTAQSKCGASEFEFTNSIKSLIVFFSSTTIEQNQP